MRHNTKLPEGLTEIAKIMQMEKEEIMAWPHLNELREVFRDYNMHSISKGVLLERMEEISQKCKDEKMEFHFEGMSKAIIAVKAFY